MTTQDTPTPEQRAAFEAMCNKSGLPLTTYVDGRGYSNERTKAALIARQAAARLNRQQRGEPSGYAYRYSSHDGGTVIRFNNGGEVNGSRPIEAIPYWFAPQPATPAQVSDGIRGEIARKLQERDRFTDMMIARYYVDAVCDELSRYGAAQPAAIPEGILLFDGATLRIEKDGSGCIVVSEDQFTLEDDRCEGPDGPQGGIHWIARIPASEIAELRAFLGAQPAASVEPCPTCQGDGTIGDPKYPRDGAHTVCPRCDGSGKSAPVAAQQSMSSQALPFDKWWAAGGLALVSKAADLRGWHGAAEQGYIAGLLAGGATAAAAPSAAEQAQQDADRVDAAQTIPDWLLHFLHGSGAIDGVWFGDPHPAYKGAFWWRILLPQPSAQQGGQS